MFMDTRLKWLTAASLQAVFQDHIICPGQGGPQTAAEFQKIKFVMVVSKPEALQQRGKQPRKPGRRPQANSANQAPRPIAN